MRAKNDLRLSATGSPWLIDGRGNSLLQADALRDVLFSLARHQWLLCSAVRILSTQKYRNVITTIAALQELPYPTTRIFPGLKYMFSEAVSIIRNRLCLSKLVRVTILSKMRTATANTLNGQSPQLERTFPYRAHNNSVCSTKALGSGELL